MSRTRLGLHLRAPCTALLLAACGDRPVDAMLAAYDSEVDEHFARLVRRAERKDMPTPTREWFDADRPWVFGEGTRSRDCFEELGNRRKYRDADFWPCLQDYVEDEDGLYAHMHAAELNFHTADVPSGIVHGCSMQDPPGHDVPWDDCFPEDSD